MGVDLALPRPIFQNVGKIEHSISGEFRILSRGHFESLIACSQCLISRFIGLNFRFTLSWAQFLAFPYEHVAILVLGNSFCNTQINESLLSGKQPKGCHPIAFSGLVLLRRTRYHRRLTRLGTCYVDCKYLECGCYSPGLNT